MGYPLCRVCKAGDLIPFSDYGEGGAELLYKGWVCNNEACGYANLIRKGDISRGYIDDLVSAPTPRQPPAPPAPPAPVAPLAPRRAPRKRSRWQAWQERPMPSGQP